MSNEDRLPEVNSTEGVAEISTVDASGNTAGNAVDKDVELKKSDSEEMAGPPDNAAEVKKTAAEEKASAREREKRRRRGAVQAALVFLMASAAVIIMILSFHVPVLQIYGVQMEPTLDAGDFVVCLETSKFEQGDLIAFAQNNKILVRRVIALGGDTVSIDEDGVVSVNEKVIDEPYISEPSLGQCNIKFPITVPDGKAFVLGDSRETAVDSRNSAVGCVTLGEAEGKVIFRIWPASGIGPM